MKAVKPFDFDDINECYKMLALDRVNLKAHENGLDGYTVADLNMILDALNEFGEDECFEFDETSIDADGKIGIAYTTLGDDEEIQMQWYLDLSRKCLCCELWKSDTDETREYISDYYADVEGMIKDIPYFDFNSCYAIANSIAYKYGWID